MKESTKNIETILGPINYVNESVIFLLLNKEMNIDKEDGVNFRNMILSLFQDQKFSIIVDARSYTGNASMDMIQYFTNDEKFNAQCENQAIIQNSLSIKLIANFYIKFVSKPVVAKLFTDYESALEWMLKN